MRAGQLASKKNVIIYVIAGLLTAYTLTSYYVKKSRVDRQMAVGGQIELVVSEPLPKLEYEFMYDNSSTISSVMDLKLTFPLVNGPLLTNVRVFDGNYPLRGRMNIDNRGMGDVFTEDKVTNTFGVAANQLFLDMSSMKIGEIFTYRGRNYQLRGVINSLPDRAAIKMSKAPLLIMRENAERGSGMWDAAQSHVLRYRLVTKTVSTRQWEEKFKNRFTQSSTAIYRWDD